jgi:hypothetical protein
MLQNIILILLKSDYHIFRIKSGTIITKSPLESLVKITPNIYNRDIRGYYLNLVFYDP